MQDREDDIDVPDRVRGIDPGDRLGQQDRGVTGVLHRRQRTRCRCGDCRRICGDAHPTAIGQDADRRDVVALAIQGTQDARRAQA